MCEINASYVQAQANSLPRIFPCQGYIFLCKSFLQYPILFLENTDASQHRNVFGGMLCCYRKDVFKEVTDEQQIESTDGLEQL